MSYKKNAIDFLWRSALADQSKARTSLDILLEHPAGIGDHSTEDLHNNLKESLLALADAEDRLETLQRYYPPQEQSNDTGE